MTTEICVMNRHALVLAADSAVTVTRWEQGRKEERYFKGTNKIFQLSAVRPVGLMIFDAADLQRVPWELIAKEFRQALGAKSYPSISDYASKLFEYIDGHLKLFPSTYRTKLFIRNVDQIMIGTLVRANDDPRVTAAGADAVAADSARRTVLSEKAAAIAGAPIKAPFTQADVEAAYNTHGAVLHIEAVEDIQRFGAQTTFDPDALVKLGIDALYRDPETYLATTGLVVAGFGDDEYFPSYVEFHCPGFIGERLFFEKKSGLSISVEDSGYFSAFATTSMVDTFTMGFARDVFGSIRKHLRTEMRELSNKIAAATGTVAPDLQTYIDDTLTSHTNKWTEDALEQHARPLRRVIGSLPIEEMASLAENLVMLESLKEKVTQPSESVSGPIDVAIITKHEGLVWANRKHFFEPKLNPRFFWRQRAEYGAIQDESDETDKV